MGAATGDGTSTMYMKLNGEMVHLWRAVDHEREVLESYQEDRDKESNSSVIRSLRVKTPVPEAAVQLTRSCLHEVSSELRDQRHASDH